MSQWRYMARLIGVDVPLCKQPIFDYLERAGMRFCYDFGLNNCQEIARAHWCSLKDKR